MAKLKRDERVCPYCAENIKASAIRCRFCQSDVIPTVEPATSPVPAPVPAAEVTAKKTPVKKAPAKKTAAKKAPAGPPVVSPVDLAPVKPARPPAYKNATLVLSVLVVIAAVAFGTAWWRAEHESPATAGGSLVGEDARTEVLVAAADLAQRSLSYDYKSLANDMEIARARMTPGFRKEYDATMAQVRANTEKNQIALQADAVSSAIISATERRAKVLVFLNQTTTAGVGATAKQQFTRNTLVVTLTRGDGDWDISKLTALG